MRLFIKNGKIYDTEARDFREGGLLAEDGVIVAILPAGEDATADTVIDAEGKLLLPGLVDVHTHGRAGYDFNTADLEGMRKMARSYLESGVTTLFPTLASAPFDALRDAADMITELSKTEEASCFAGVHLEGRYLNVAKRGAHAESLLAPLDATELRELRIYFRQAAELMPPADFFGTRDDFRIYVPRDTDYNVDYNWVEVVGIGELLKFMED